MSSKTFTSDDVKNIAKLANIPIKPEEEEKLANGFNTTIEVVEQLNKLDTESVEPTHQVTGLINVFRDDVIDQKRTLTQDQALMNTTNTHNGYFVVDQVLEE